MGEGRSARPAAPTSRWGVRDFALFRQRFRTARRWLGDRYGEIDRRTLGIYRIVLGALLSGDCLRHWWYARDYYSNEGLLKNHFHLFRPSSEFNFSLFHAFSTLGEVHVAFALSLLCYLLLMVGYRARLFAVLSLIWVTSMDNRLVMVENGGYVVVNLMTFWAMFLPIGDRFSVDSLRRSLKDSRERSVDDLNDRRLPERLTRPFRSLGAFIITANFATVYVFNVVNKYGDTWRQGKTVWYVLHIDRMATGIAVFFRELLPFWATWAITHAVLIVEAMIVMLIAWPSGRRWSRPLAMALVLGLHTAFGVMFRLGPFSWFMIGWSTVLLMAVHFEQLEGFYRARVAPLTVRIHAESGAAFQLARLAKRLDRAELLTFEAAASGPWLTVHRDAERREGRAALLAIARTFPGGKWWLPAARLLSLGLLDASLAVLARHPTGVGRFFGLAPAGGPSRPAAAAPSPHPGCARRWLGRLREATLAMLLVCAASQIINENKSIPKVLKHQQPKAMRAIVQYPRIFQGWGMFAPNPVREDGYLTVDAVTVDGRHVDPFTGREPDMNLSDARGLGLGQIVQDYANRIRLDGNRVFRKGLREWVASYHRRTGRPEDEIVQFNAYWLRDQNPEPGAPLEPFDHEAICIETWRKPGYRPPQGQSLPRPCRIESAEKKDKDDDKRD